MKLPMNESVKLESHPGNAQRWRWLIPALLLPLAIATCNYCVLSWISVYSLRDPVQTSFCFLLFVLQVGAASVFAGRFLSGWQRWLIFGWTLVILDVMTFTVAVSGQDIGEILAFALISGQLGTLVIWGVLGAQRWIVRVPMAIAGLLTATLLWNSAFSLTQLWGGMYYFTTWLGLVVLQLALLGGICIFLRWQGCRMSPVRNGSSPLNQQSSIWQFHLREILLQTAIVAIVITVIRATFPSRSGYSNPMSLASVGMEFLVSLGLVLVMVSALWAVLSKQVTKSWLAVLFANIVFIGAGLGLGSSLIVGNSNQSLRYYRSWWWLVELEWWWLPWTCLAAGFLAATLWIFREAGYRLVRAERK